MFACLTPDCDAYGLHLITSRLRDCYEVVLLEDAKLAVKERILESLWQNCYYSFIQEHRKVIRTLPRHSREKKTTSHTGSPLSLLLPHPCRWIHPSLMLQEQEQEQEQEIIGGRHC